MPTWCRPQLPIILAPEALKAIQAFMGTCTHVHIHKHRGLHIIKNKNRTTSKHPYISAMLLILEEKHSTFTTENNVKQDYHELFLFCGGMFLIYLIGWHFHVTECWFCWILYLHLLKWSYDISCYTFYYDILPFMIHIQIIPIFWYFILSSHEGWFF